MADTPIHKAPPPTEHPPLDSNYLFLWGEVHVIIPNFLLFCFLVGSDVVSVLALNTNGVHILHWINNLFISWLTILVKLSLLLLVFVIIFATMADIILLLYNTTVLCIVLVLLRKAFEYHMLVYNAPWCLFMPFTSCYRMCFNISMQFMTSIGFLMNYRLLTFWHHLRESVSSEFCVYLWLHCNWMSFCVGFDQSAYWWLHAIPDIVDIQLKASFSPGLEECLAGWQQPESGLIKNVTIVVTVRSSFSVEGHRGVYYR